MATEEEAAAPAHPAPPPPVIEIPPYPQLILLAIEAVGGENGANKTMITKHMASRYGKLPPGHTTLLCHYLNRMKQSGELLWYNNNYHIPDPNAPPRRGRGRPPKENNSATSPPRPRGRPPKAVDPDAPAKTKSPSVSGRKRGRPKKSKVSAPSQVEPEPEATAVVED